MNQESVLYDLSCNLQDPKMVRLSYSRKMGVKIQDQESDHEMSDSDDELVKEILPLPTPISPLTSDLSKPKMIRIRKLHSEAKKSAKGSKRSRSVKDTSDHRKHGLPKHIDQKHKTSPNPHRTTSNKDPYPQSRSRFTTAMIGGPPVDWGCPPHLKNMKDHEMGYIKIPLPRFVIKEGKKEHKDDKKEKGRKCRRKPSENATKKYKCEESGCTYDGNKKQHLDLHIKARHKKIKLECDICNFKCGDPR